MTSALEIRFHCPECAKSIVALSEYAGRKGKCPRCHTLVKVPTKSYQTSIKPIRKVDMTSSVDSIAEQKEQAHMSTCTDQMRNSFRCPVCGTNIKILPQQYGKPGHCPICDALLRFPRIPEQKGFDFQEKSKLKKLTCFDSPTQRRMTTTKEAISNAIKNKSVTRMEKPNVAIIFGSFLFLGGLFGLANVRYLILGNEDQFLFGPWIETALLVGIIIEGAIKLGYGIGVKIGIEWIQRHSLAVRDWAMGIFLLGWATLYLFAGGWKQTWNGTIFSFLFGIMAYMSCLKYIVSAMVRTGLISED